MDALPLSIGFAVSYLDGIMTIEQREIQQMWAIVRKHMMESELRGSEQAEQLEVWKRAARFAEETIDAQSLELERAEKRIGELEELSRALIGDTP